MFFWSDGLQWGLIALGDCLCLLTDRASRNILLDKSFHCGPPIILLKCLPRFPDARVSHHYSVMISFQEAFVDFALRHYYQSSLSVENAILFLTLMKAIPFFKNALVCFLSFQDLLILLPRHQGSSEKGIRQGYNLFVILRPIIMVWSLREGVCLIGGSRYVIILGRNLPACEGTLPPFNLSSEGVGNVQDFHGLSRL